MAIPPGSGLLYRAVLTVLTAESLLWLSYAQTPAVPAVDYTRDVHVLIAERCLVCHTQEKRSGGLSLATYDDILAGGRTGAAIKPGASADSLIVKRITGSVEPRMPLGGGPLSGGQIATIQAWIDQGARAAPHAGPGKARWEPQLTLTAPPVPEVTWSAWSNPVDRFTSRYLSQQGVTQPAVVGDAEFARRAYLDIWGLLPDPDQLRAFTGDKSPGKRATLVAYLLADPVKYSGRWVSYWNDLLRNEEGVTYYSETATRKSITPWLLNALQTNKPYVDWVRQLLNPSEAGDPDGFLTGVNWRGSVSASQTPAMQASQNTAQIFLGINFKCNACHDSFISRWKLKDAYALAAYFSAEPKLQLYRCDVAQPDQYATAGYMYPELNRPLPSDSIVDRRATVAAIFTDPRNGRVPRTLVNRVWAQLMGRGIVENVDDMDGEPWSPALLDWLASDFAGNGYDIKRLIAAIAGSRTYQLPSVRAAATAPKQYSFRGPGLRRLTAEQFADAIASVTGDWHVAPAPSPANSATGNIQVGTASDRVAAVFSGEPVEAAGVNPGGRGAGGRGGGGGGGAAAQNGPGGLPGRAGAQGAPSPLTGQLQGGDYAREWKIAGNSLSRALGRPIRDQVFSTRDTLPTTIQALELVNGDTLTHWLWRGAQRMLGELPPEPKSLFSRQVGGAPGRGGSATAVPFSIDVSQARKIWLIVEDSLSTAPDKATPLWLNAVLSGPNGATPLRSLKPVDTGGLRESGSPIVPLGGAEAVTDAVRVKFPSVLVYDIAGKGFTRFEGVPLMENVPLTQGESVTARFFVFDQQPGLDRLAPPNPATPLPPGPVLTAIPQTVDRVYWYLLGRAPLAAERRIASAALRDPSRPGHPSAQGLADLLWALLMSPEFQFIR